MNELGPHRVIWEGIVLLPAIPGSEIPGNGKYLHISDFHNACEQAGTTRAEGTYLFGRIVRMLAVDAPKSAQDLIEHDLLNPYPITFVGDEYERHDRRTRERVLVATQPTFEIAKRIDAGEKIKGIGNKNSRLLRAIIFDTDIDSVF